jgi:hypothetical protein
VERARGDAEPERPRPDRRDDTGCRGGADRAQLLVLRSTGVPVSLLDSIAVLIAMVVIAQLPVGPSVGAAATVLILGTQG